MSLANRTFVVATIRPWNVEVFNRTIRHFQGEWHLIDNPEKFTLDLLESLGPEYIFFPHWSEKISEEILSRFTCVCFHETDLPYGRGGSPIQNLLIRGHKSTVVSAIEMTTGFDEGPVYLKRPLSLEGLAEEIFLRSANTIAEMISYIITENPVPIPQEGAPTVFTRRTPGQSQIPSKIQNLEELFDFLRMLDCQEYPKAYLETQFFKLEFTRPALRTGSIEADVKITLKTESDD